MARLDSLWTRMDTYCTSVGQLEAELSIETIAPYVMGEMASY